MVDARTEACERFFGSEADRLAQLCKEMAERFARGGRLLACGTSPADVSDARHVAVEFVHPVIVGKRALPALALPPGEIAAPPRARRHGDRLRGPAGRRLRSPSPRRRAIRS